MRLKPYAVVQTPIPAEVRDEAVLVPRGDTRYWLLLTDDLVEQLARGVVSEELSQRAFMMLAWKREGERETARDERS